jgi:hypothetical protein
MPQRHEDTKKNIIPLSQREEDLLLAIESGYLINFNVPKIKEGIKRFVI